MITGHPSQPEFLHATYRGHGIILSFEVSDVDAEHKKALEAGMPLAHEIRTEPWSQRHFMLRDPNGVVVDIGVPVLRSRLLMWILNTSSAGLRG